MAERGASEVLAGIALVRTHAARGGLRRRGRVAGVAALRGVSLALHAGEILGVVGHSGAGKSTLARVLTLLEPPDAGEVRFGGERVDTLSEGERRWFRRSVQIVFQDPGSTLDPLQRVRAAIAEPLDVHGLHRGAGREARIAELLAAVGLAGDGGLLARFPRELSGGERQRVAIARALACEPSALVLDEPVSALDVSVRNQVLNVLVDLRERLGLAILLIAHDLALVAEVCDRMAVMLAGRVIETGPADQVFAHPLHPHTRFLVRCALGEDPGDGGGASGSGDLAAPTVACPLLGACAAAGRPCAAAPGLFEHDDGRRVACYFPCGP
jgi:ABC-type glutathione transport system ATPase component